MQFEVTRTSSSYGGDAPCEGAVAGTVPRWDRRTSASPEMHDRLMRERFGSGPPPPWLSEGTEHCKTENGIARRMGDREAWLIEIPSLEALAEFVSRYGDVVIQSGFRAPHHIEIYDDYRE